MVFDSNTEGSIRMTSGLKDPGKKKRTNRSSKLKQCKLDARREQWLSRGDVKNSRNHKGAPEGQSSSHVRAVGDRSSKKSVLTTIHGLCDGSRGTHNESDSGSSSNSPASFNGSLSSKESGANYSRSSSSCCSVGSYSRSISDLEDSDGCLDDWEAIADALGVDEKRNDSSTTGGCHKNGREVSDSNRPRCFSSIPGFTSEAAGREIKRVLSGGRAWRADDVYRPHSLPNLEKQHLKFTVNQFKRRAVANSLSPSDKLTFVALPCPICYEELDRTDTSFHPCLCGFRLCLFCHKRILEVDGRCPGCRKPYLNSSGMQGESSLDGGGSSAAIHLTLSPGMVSRA